MLICNVGPLEEHVASVRALVATGDQQKKVVEELNALQESLSYKQLQQIIAGELHAADALADLLNVMETHEAVLKHSNCRQPRRFWRREANTGSSHGIAGARFR